MFTHTEIIGIAELFALEMMQLTHTNKTIWNKMNIESSKRHAIKCLMDERLQPTRTGTPVSGTDSDSD